MSRILVVGEDSLSCALGERLVEECLPTWSLARESLDTGGITKMVAALPRYAQLARNVYPVLCVADTDGACAKDLLSRWQPRGATREFSLRLAVAEAESWLLADRHAAAEFFAVPIVKIPLNPDLLPDPKAIVLRLARSSKIKSIRQEVVSTEGDKPGAGYNLHLCKFVRNQWGARRGAEQSPSLNRALRRVAAFA